MATLKKDSLKQPHRMASTNKPHRMADPKSIDMANNQSFLTSIEPVLREEHKNIHLTKINKRGEEMPKNTDKPQEIHWIDYCYEQLIDYVGISPHLKDFNEGYFKARKIVEDHLKR